MRGAAVVAVTESGGSATTTTTTHVAIPDAAIGALLQRIEALAAAAPPHPPDGRGRSEPRPSWRITLTDGLEPNRHLRLAGLSAVSTAVAIRRIVVRDQREGGGVVSAEGSGRPSAARGTR